MSKEVKEFHVAEVGIVRAIVCTSLSDDEATKRLNEEHPTGISSRWEIDPIVLDDGTQTPCKCLDNPDTHRHIIFSC